MKAMILNGKERGKVVEVLQWCNDWFKTDDKKEIYVPTALAFNAQDFETIVKHKNNGSLFVEFERIMAPPRTGLYLWTFRKIK